MSGRGMRGQSQGLGRGRGNRGNGNGGGFNGAARGHPPASNGNGTPQGGGGQRGGGANPPGNWAQKAGGATGGNWPTPGETGPAPRSNGPAGSNGPNAWGARGGGSGGSGPPPGGRGQLGPNGTGLGPSRGNGQQPRQGGQEQPEKSGAARGQRLPRTIAPRPDQKPQYSRDDVVETRKLDTTDSVNGKMKKTGTAGTKIELLSNYFTLVKKTGWNLFQYKVDFNPDEHTTKIRKALFREHGKTVGIHMFDGYHLYTVHRLHPNPKEIKILHSKREDETPVEMEVRLVAEIAPCDPTMLHFFNIIVRKCLQGLNLDEIGRHFFDGRAAKRNICDGMSIEFWPGYVTSMRQCENDVLLRVEIKHKLIRTDSVYTVISKLWDQRDFENIVKDEVVGSIVMTHYNKKTYKITDVNWELTPASTFDHKGVQKTYIKYYKERYDVTIRNPEQPLLIALPSKKDMHRGDTGIIYLIPELCQTTGLTDKMRGNQLLMREIAAHLHIKPSDRINRVQDFMNRVKATPEIQTVLSDWGMKFSNQIVDVPGRVLPNEKILFAPKHQGGQKTAQIASERGEWTLQSSNYPMTKNAQLNTWVIIVTQRDLQHIDRLVGTMKEVAAQLGFHIPKPAEVFPVQFASPACYSRGIEEAMSQFGGKIDLIFTLLPSNKVDIYSAIKRKCYSDLGVTSQVFLQRHMNSKNFKSIATKLVIQMNAKLGGIPWEVEVPPPLKDTMMVGFDVYHCAGEKGKSIGALVASTNMSWGEYYSTTSKHCNGDELAGNLCTDMKKALTAYHNRNKCLPLRIIFFRDGVGEGQLNYVFRIELEQIKTAIQEVYHKMSIEAAKFTMIVVTKRIETRLFTKLHRDNPLPGTVVDDIITLPERHDFYLVSQTTRNGTVSPTAYHVLYNDGPLNPGQLQQMTYKMCHLYFNCSTNVAVPAPCQYAHKLAFLTGVSLKDQCQERLLNQLYYL